MKDKIEDLLLKFKNKCEDILTDHSEFDLIKNYEAYNRDIKELIKTTTKELKEAMK